MIPKYIIIGAGPSGLSLAYFLTLNGRSVELYEKDSIVGGSWKSEWVNGMYWSENAPRILSYGGNTRSFLEDIGIAESDLENVYGGFPLPYLKVINFIRQYFTFSDYIIYILSTVKYSFVKSKETVGDWCAKSGLSSAAKNAIRIICITINDRPENTNINDFFRTRLASFQQFKDSNLWHQKAIGKLSKYSNFRLFTGTTVRRLFHQDNDIQAIECMNEETQEVYKVFGSQFFLCTQSDGLLPILTESSSHVRNNWMDFESMETWCRETYYSAFSFQLHFTEELNVPDTWCWSCTGDWTVIILPVSEWLSKKSRDSSIKTVWSCCITDLNNQSLVTKKTANQSTREEVVIECLRQISLTIDFPSPSIVTFAPGLVMERGGWKSRYTGFTQKRLGKLPMKGKLNNLFALGCFTDTTQPSIALMETAITASFNYILQYEVDIVLPRKKNNICLFLMSIFFIFLFYMFFIVPSYYKWSLS